MSVRAESKAIDATSAALSVIEQAHAADSTTAEGNSFNIASEGNPLRRIVNVSIKASLNDFCLQKTRATWAPSQEALRSIFQQRRFTSLEGSAEPMGDLKERAAPASNSHSQDAEASLPLPLHCIKGIRLSSRASIVLHELSVNHTKSTFPMSLGTNITGVDNVTFSSTGEAFSSIVLPNSESHFERKLQADDVSLAYEFAKKFPGYTSQNLSEKGVHEVSQRRFVLVAADHPIVSAITENADKLQMGEISMMPEGLVKIGQSLYESILPLVKTQVESQIKVRDLSRAQVTIKPAEYASWSEARNELMVEAKRPLKAQLSSEVAAAANDDEAFKIRERFAQKEMALEHMIDQRPLDLHMELDVSYNFLS